MTIGSEAARFDVAVIGAGPVGATNALAWARKGARVLLLEANPQASGKRLAGEWLHPPAVESLRQVGIDLGDGRSGEQVGHGFVVFPDDGSEPMTLGYTDGSLGFGIEHGNLVSRIRETAIEHRNIEYLPFAKVCGIEGNTLQFTKRGQAGTLLAEADRIVGADGRASVVRGALGLDVSHEPCSRMAGVLLENCELPSEGFGHVFLGGPGPALSYRITPEHVRIIMDVPLSEKMGRDKGMWLYEAFRPVIPAQMEPAFRRALLSGQISWARNAVKPRIHYGSKDLCLVGDAIGHYHPLTAVGMTLGFGDAVALPDAADFQSYRRKRMLSTRVPEMLAVALYEVFADSSDETVAIRHAVYDLWRRFPHERERTMRFLAGQDTQPQNFGSSFLHTLGIVASKLTRDGIEGHDTERLRHVAGDLAHRVRWLVSGALHLSPPTGPEQRDRQSYGEALKVSKPQVEVEALGGEPPHQIPTPAQALARSAKALEREQRDDGSYEGEVVWCAMLTAQYALMCHITGQPVSDERRATILKQFEVMQDERGLWGLHEISEPYLFTTTLVYTAARLLGVDKDDPLLSRARVWILAQGGAREIPSWGKFWLAMLGLYDWRGVNAVLPEAWGMPKWLPLHPSNYYCHTRLIYMAMATIFGERYQVPQTEAIRELRGELWNEDFDAIDWPSLRGQLRAEEIDTQPSRALKAFYKLSAVVDRRHRPKKRKALLAELRDFIRWELRTTDYTCISPVSGMLNLIALWINDPSDETLQRGLARFEGWLWEDMDEGLRVAGARSATWDTGFALQALAQAAPHTDVREQMRAGRAFLQTQQIQESFPGYADRFRVDPKGGFCFAGVWHGWPVSDCTAEAALGILDATEALGEQSDAQFQSMRNAVEFILQAQNPDGGFGSYEAQKSRIGLEWLNPAEMFGESMTEHSYSECTASCIAALRAFRDHWPDVQAERIDHAIARAARRLRLQQRADGSWLGVWGITFTYGTMFGIRGLLAAGAPPQDPAIRKACAFLRATQRPDGGWGERYESCTSKQYSEHHESQVTQTAWALSALLEAEDPDFDAMERAARFLARKQDPQGIWAHQDPAGVFFHTALLDYRLYRRYFPMWALGQFETRRKAREALRDASRPRRRKVASAAATTA